MTVTKHIHVWTVEDRWQCSVNYMHSTFGDWCWGVTDMMTGEGLGGWEKTLEDAHKAADKQLELSKESVATHRLHPDDTSTLN